MLWHIYFSVMNISQSNASKISLQSMIHKHDHLDCLMGMCKHLKIILETEKHFEPRSLTKEKKEKKNEISLH